MRVGVLDVRQYRAVHRHLFQDVYSWAGRFRTVRISKGSSMFCYPENIPAEMDRLFRSLGDQDELRGRDRAAFARQSAHVLAELNAIHPFREGNGRCQLVFLVLIAERAGHPLDLDRMEPGAMLAAMIRSFDGDETALRDLVLDLASPSVHGR